MGRKRSLAIANVPESFSSAYRGEMRRLSRSEIENLIAVALATAPPTVKSKLRSKLTTHKDWARDELAKLIAAKVDNDSSMVIVTELLGTLPYDRPGKWGVDEPDPTR